jgi:hypothetical protein
MQMLLLLQVLMMVVGIGRTWVLFPFLELMRN